MSVRLIIFLIFVLAVGMISILVSFFKCGHFFKALFFSVLSGSGVMLALHFTSLMTSLTLPINPISLTASAIGGLPTVIAMIILKFI